MQPIKSHPLAGILKNNPQLIVPVKESDSFEAELLARDGRRAFFDLDGKGTGILFGSEFLNAKDILKGVDVGEKCTVTVTGPENEDGYFEVSLLKALWQQNWQEVKKLKEAGETAMVKIAGANTGGLMAELYGIKAFIPVSQLSAQNYPHVEDGDKNKILDELKKMIGKDMEVKVLDFNPRAEKLILSEREVTGEEVKKTLEKYKEGDVVEVIVSGVADFGVFVKFTDDPNIEGLVHISEIDHKLIDSPKEVVKVNDSLKAKIIEVKNGRVSLSLKALKPNPWDEAGKYFALDQEVKGTIVKINPFGALVYLGHDLQGLIHISEFESQEKMKVALEIGKEYDFVVSQLKPEEKRIILKLKK
ncbi:MAG: RNA binding S1 domain protein [Parcubacteria group bacterium GW2011_GWA1_Parcubacteria_45_10]|nr:MAG: RNA binding S1 domain protein [Parcubacteria group bacterium GW2011_GWA1_Parcubacteria_45_10]